jgi:hypothetical protein
MIIRKHIVKVTYLDYGHHLDTCYRLATSVDGGRPVTDSGEYHTWAAASAARDGWLTESETKGKPAGVLVAAGDDIERTCDMNPHGLI